MLAYTLFRKGWCSQRSGHSQTRRLRLRPCAVCAATTPHNVKRKGDTPRHSIAGRAGSGEHRSCGHLCCEIHQTRAGVAGVLRQGSAVGEPGACVKTAAGPPKSRRVPLLTDAPAPSHHRRHSPGGRCQYVLESGLFIYIPYSNSLPFLAMNPMIIPINSFCDAFTSLPAKCSCVLPVIGYGTLLVLEVISTTFITDFCTALSPHLHFIRTDATLRLRRICTAFSPHYPVVYVCLP